MNQGTTPASPGSPPRGTSHTATASNTATTPGSTSTGTGNNVNKRQLTGGIFEDFNFRFSNTYTVVGQDSTTTATQKRLAHNNGQQQQQSSASGGGPGAMHPPRSLLHDISEALNDTTTDTSGGDSGGVQLTGQFAAGLRRQEERRQLQQRKDAVQASTLLSYTHSQKAPVAPCFVAATATVAAAAENTVAAAAPRAAASSHRQPPAQPVTAVGPLRPVARPLPAPALGLAAGVEAGIMGAESTAYALTAGEQRATLSSERGLNEEVFRWWDERAATRAHARFRTELDAALQPALECGAKELIAQEESYWLVTLTGDSSGAHSNTMLGATQARVNPRLKALSTHHGGGTAGKREARDMMAVNNGLTPAGATSRGIIVPIKNMEILFRGLRAMLHGRASALLDTYEGNQRAARSALSPDVIERMLAGDDGVYDEDNDDDGGGDGEGGEELEGAGNSTTSSSARRRHGDIRSEQRRIARDARRALLDRLRKTEALLARDALKAATVDLTTTTIDPHSSSITPACVSLPPDRLLHPLMVIETAASAALLWKLLEQARTVIPGMGFGLDLYRHYLLPHLYVGYESFDGILPRQVGSLADQVGRLCALPLRTRAFLLSADATAQAKDDVLYMEQTMKHWTLRTWRKSVNDRKRREISVAACAGLLGRAARRDALRRTFGAWRLEARQSGQARYTAGIDAAYREFLTGSQLSTKLDYLPDFNISGGGDGTTTNRARILASKLAETATMLYTKPKPKKRSSNPVGLGGGPPAQMDLARSAARDTPPSGHSLFSGSQESGGPPGPNLRSKTSVAHSDHPNNDSDHEEEDGDGDGDDAAPEEVEATPLPASAHPTPVYTAVHGGPFEEMLSRLREMEEVCGHLRGEIGVQSGMLRRLELDKTGLQDRNRALERDLLRTVEEKLQYCNLVQERQFQLQVRDRSIMQLKSRLRAHRNRPWQRTVMRVMGELCGASTQVAEAMDEHRLRRDFRSDPAAIGAAGFARDTTAPAAAASGGGGVDGEERRDSAREDDLALGSLLDDGPGARDAEQERLFGSLAPIVLSSTRQMPDALVILQDWANACLDDLQSLDDLKGGALSVRFSSFSEEARSGVLLSRLLFYLALPRYLHRTATSNDEGDDSSSSGPAGKSSRGSGANASGISRDDDGDDDGAFFGTGHGEHRRQLLEHRNVQLDAPFPVYSACFGDLLIMKPQERMTLLLQFASELVGGTDAPLSDALELRRRAVDAAVFAATDLAPAPSTRRIELLEVVNPHALAAGERVSFVTLIALLYTRFAHPFNHKCRQSAAAERAAMVYLLSGSSTTMAHMTTGSGEGSGGGGGAVQAAHVMTVEEELLANLDDEDKTPWQLFKERCLPVFGSDAHPLLLRGNFWPCDAFDSPSLAAMLGELGMALNRSLHLHRWHIILSCLVPAMTYSGLSRAVFTGPRASAAALRVGLEQSGQFIFPLHSACIGSAVDRRCRTVLHTIEGHMRTTTTDDAVAVRVVEEKRQLMDVMAVFSQDLLSLFLQRATLSAEIALPTMDLGAWRMLLGDVALLSLRIGGEDGCPLDLDEATAIYFGACTALVESCSSTGNIDVLGRLFPTAESRSPGGVSKKLEPIVDHLVATDHSPLLANNNSSTGSPLQPPQAASSPLRLVAVNNDALEALRGNVSPGAGGGGGGGSRSGSNDGAATATTDEALTTSVAGGAVAVPPLAAMAEAGGASRSGSRQGQGSAAAAAVPTPSSHGPSFASSADTFVQLPHSHMAMTFTVFLTAITLVADTVFPARRGGVSDGDGDKEEGEGKGKGGKDSGASQPHRWLGDALRSLVRRYIICSPTGNALLDEPRSVIRRLTMGAATQELIGTYSPALLLVFTAHSKDIYGVAGMDREDLMLLLRKAMLTSTEISQYLVQDLFAVCCVTRRSDEEAAGARRREIDGRHRNNNHRAAGGDSHGLSITPRRAASAVSIVDPSSHNLLSATAGGAVAVKRKEVLMLTLDGFIEFLCVLCHFKQPNPLIPLHHRLGVFLRRSLLRPLYNKVEGVSNFLSRLKAAQDAEEEAKAATGDDAKGNTAWDDEDENEEHHLDAESRRTSVHGRSVTTPQASEKSRKK